MQRHEPNPALSEGGQVAGAADVGPMMHAFVWNQADGMSNLEEPSRATTGAKREL